MAQAMVDTVGISKLVSVTWHMRLQLSLTDDQASETVGEDMRPGLRGHVHPLVPGPITPYTSASQDAAHEAATINPTAFDQGEKTYTIHSQKRLYRYPNRMPHFFPRQTLFDSINKRLCSVQDFIPRTVVLTGMGGQGKTQLALDFCWKSEQSKTYGVILWFNASSEQALKQSYEAYWSIIKYPDQILLESADRLEAMIENISSWTRKWLLVFDNYDNPDLLPGIRKYMPRSPNGSVIVTSRRKELHRTGDVISIPGLTPHSCVKFLLDQRYFKGKPIKDDVDAALEMAERLGGLPLALDQARAYIAARNLSFREFLSHFETRKKTVLSELPDDWEYRAYGEGAGNTALSVYTTWQLSFDCVSPTYGGAEGKIALLVMITCLDFGNVSEEFFNIVVKPDKISNHVTHATCKALSPFRGRRSWNHEALEGTFYELSRLSLLQDYSKDGRPCRKISIHPLICEWLRLRTSGATLSACYEDAFQLIVGVCVTHLQTDSSEADPENKALTRFGEEDAVKHLTALSSVRNTSRVFSNPSQQSSHLEELDSVTTEIESLRFSRLQQIRSTVWTWLIQLAPGALEDVSLALENVSFNEYVDPFPSHQTNQSPLSGLKHHESFKAWPNSHICYIGEIGSGKTVMSIVAAKELRKDL